MKKIFFICALINLSFLLSAAEEPGKEKDKDKETKEITFVADNDQRYMTTKLYQLKHVKAIDIEPWVSGAIKRNCPQANTDCFDYIPATCSYISVSMTREMVPYIDDMIKKMDRPGKSDKFGSIIQGTDVSFFTYTPKYRASQNMADIVYKSLRYNLAAFYLNPNTNAFYWKDAKDDGAAAITWLEFLDRPLPQVEISVIAYEINENDLIDLGIDYVHWKNGPGLNIFSAGADLTSFHSSEATQLGGMVSDYTSNYGGFMVAPQFDASFIRMLQQRGKARVATSTSLRIVNHSINKTRQDSSKQVASKTYSISFTPSFQNITKDSDMKTTVGTESLKSPQITFTISDPTIFFAAKEGLDASPLKDPSGSNAARMYFSYTLKTYNSVQRDVMGTQAFDYNILSSSINLESNTEKLLGSYSQQYDVYENIGVPFVKDVPVLKYLFSTTTRTKARNCYYVTVRAESISPKSSLAEWAGSVVRENKNAIEKVNEDLKDR